MSEIEPSARAVLKHLYPDTPLHGDFTTIQKGDYGPIDVLVGGTPCQSFSVAGLRGGLSDDRGNLALEYLKLAERLRPGIVCWENVPGVLSSLSHDAPDPCQPPDDMAEGSEWVGEDEYDADESHAFACFLAGLSEIGYGWAYRIYDAQYFGLAQRRERVFVVGSLGGWADPSEILSLREGLRWDTAPRRETGEGVAASLIRGADSGVANPLGAKRDGGWRGDLDNDTYAVSDTLRDHPRAGSNTVGNVAVVPLLEIGKGSTSRGHGPNGAGFGADGDPMFTLQAGAQHGIAVQTSQSGVRLHDTHATLDANNGSRRHNGVLAMALNARGGSGRMDGESETFVVEFAPALSRSNPYGDHESREGLLVASAYRTSGNCGAWDTGDRVDALNTGTDPSSHLVTHSLRAEGFDASEDGTGRGVPLVTVGFQSNAGGQNGEVYENLSPAIKAQATGGSGMPAVAFQDRFCGNEPWNVAESRVVRRLSPLECQRLQGFPDSFFDGILYLGKPLADGVKYRLLGNSMAVPVMRHIGEQIARTYHPDPIPRDGLVRGGEGTQS